MHIGRNEKYTRAVISTEVEKSFNIVQRFHSRKFVTALHPIAIGSK